MFVSVLACRKFLDRVGMDSEETVLYANQHGYCAKVKSAPPSAKGTAKA